MAIFKVVNSTYMYQNDLSNLLYYIVNPQKLLMEYSNMLYYEDISMVVTQWMYHHIYHHKPTNLAYQYILSFKPDPKHSDPDNYTMLNIMMSISALPCFQNINLLMGLHKETPMSHAHIHIAVDTINKVTGNNLFIESSKLIDDLGRLLSSYNIPLIKYNELPIRNNYMPIQFAM